MEQKKIKPKQRYAFLKLNESEIKVELSDDLTTFRKFNHYGFYPTEEQINKLNENRGGIISFTGNDTCYYIMQHGAWRYMNLDLRATLYNSFIPKLKE